FFFSSRRRHTRSDRDWSSDVCSSDLWIKTPVDAFILERLRKEGLKPAPPADRATLLRRVTYDLTGLPATPAEIDAFVADKSPKRSEERRGGKEWRARRAAYDEQKHER